MQTRSPKEKLPPPTPMSPCMVSADGEHSQTRCWAWPKGRLSPHGKSERAPCGREFSDHVVISGRWLHQNSRSEHWN